MNELDDDLTEFDIEELLPQKELFSLLPGKFCLLKALLIKLFLLVQV